MATIAEGSRVAPLLDASRSVVSVVRVIGEQDFTTGAALRERLKVAATQDPTGVVVVDLAGVTFMDCAGLRPLREARHQLGPRLQLWAVSRPVLRLLRLTGLTASFDVADTDAVLLPAATYRRATIEQAKGLVMGTHHCSPDQAWELLVGIAQQHRVPVRDLATALTGMVAGTETEAIALTSELSAAVSAVLHSAGPAPVEPTRR